MQTIMRKLRVILAFFLILGSFLFLPWEAYGAADGFDLSREETEGEEPSPEVIEPEKVVLVGDSRVVDLFSGKKSIYNGKKINGLKVYARDGAQFPFLRDTIKKIGYKKFDVLVVWMGTNDGGCFSNYASLYKTVVKNGKRLILCTAGPIADQYLTDFWRPFYSNAQIKSYNSELNKWVKKNGAEVIPLYKFIKKNIRFDSADGIHYLPRPTKKLKNYLFEELRALNVPLEAQN